MHDLATLAIIWTCVFFARYLPSYPRERARLPCCRFWQLAHCGLMWAHSIECPEIKRNFAEQGIILIMFSPEFGGTSASYYFERGVLHANECSFFIECIDTAVYSMTKIAL